MTTIPVKKDTAPPAIRDMTQARLYDNDEFTRYLDGRCSSSWSEDDCTCGAPDEWLEAAAMEAYVAFTEALDTWVTTLIQGRPPTQPLVEWEHRDLDNRLPDAAEMLAEMGQARRELAEAEREGLS
ncbi:MAG: hypothetical protein IIB17_05540 [Chloroflexi bacterium]|nr:hypothetical protein [Chloroflexota bacterium]